VTVNIRVLKTEISVSLSYWDSCLSKGQALNVASTFSAALRGILCNVETVGDLDVFSNHHKIQIQDWNRIYTDPVMNCVHQTFENQVAVRSKHLAISAWDGEFTYLELNLSSDRLAHHLKGLGLKHGDLVPLCFDKSAWTIVAMLAVLKAGGACISVSATFPASRLKKIVQEANAHIVLAAPLHGHLFSNIVSRVFEVSAALMQQLPDIRGPACITVTSQSPAFVLFTSGSTGEPKGIVLEHGAICTSVSEHGPALQIGPDSRVLQFSAYIYDVSFGEIFTTLMRGGCICVPSEEERVNDLASAMNKLEVNWAFLTPTVAGLLKPSEVKTLKVLALGGEFATRNNIQSWVPNVFLINTYGPAECAIWCSYQPELRVDSSPANVGRTTGSRRWVVDQHDHNRLVPIGCVGELLVEGPTLARGYLNDSKKTTQAFIEQPQWLDIGVNATLPRRRFYKTGDLVRYNSDGTINIIGRKDTQIKLHGQRIELGEIEYHLKHAAPEGWQVAVELIKPAGKALLAAFFGVNDGQNQHEACVLPVTLGVPETLVEIQSELTQSLPRFMVPTAYIPLTSIPLTAGGKTNRKILREIGLTMTVEQLNSLSSININKAPPTSAMEKQLQELWASTLGISPRSIGVNDDFFHLGGDSIYAMKLVAAAREVGLGITVASIFRHPTLSRMTDELSHVEDTAQKQISPFELLQIPTDTWADLRTKAARVCKITATSIQDIYPCTPLQDGLMALSIKNQGAYVSQSIFRLPIDIDISRFKASWEAVVKQVDILRTRIVEDLASSSLLQVVIDEKIQWIDAVELEKYLKEDHEFSVGIGEPLVRFALIGVAPNDRHFVWTVHHALYDGWSKALVLNCVYAQYQRIEATPLVPFKEFIYNLGTANSGVSAQFWRTQLTDANQINFPSLPSVDYQARTDRRDFYNLKFVRAQRAASNITSATIIRAAWAIVVGRYSASDDVVFGATLSGRNTSDHSTASIAGPTITTVPVRCRIDKAASVTAFLKQVQRQAADMFAHEQFGLQNIGRLGSEIREASSFQNLLIVNSTPTESPKDELFRESAVPGHQADFLTYPLTLECTLSSGGANVVAQYDSNLIVPEQISRLVMQFEHVLGQLAVEDPRAFIRDIEIISPQDKLDVLAWNDRPLERAQTCIHHMVEEQVYKQQNALAVCSWDGELTYAQLEQVSNRLAQHLIGVGVGPSVMVPFCFDKSLWAVVSMLAILKAGGCFVAVDPSHPRGRLENIIRETNASISITEPRHVVALQDLTETSIIVEPSFINKLRFVAGPPKTGVLPQDPAVVVFTSGSTGTPKGIVLEHAALSSSIIAHGPILQIGTSSRVLQFASHAFDVSIGEIFTTLTLGGCVCIPSNNDRMNNLVGAINSLAVNWAYLTPSVATLIDPEEVPGLKVLALGGETPMPENVATWSTKAHLINIYGPAECSIWSTCLPLVRYDSQPTNIGYGVASRSWIVDMENHHRLAPVGCIGELLLEGPILARGYLNDEKKTAAAFISHPDWLQNIPNGEAFSVYKTGDLVKYNSNGSVDYIGRKDTQIKLHGQRVELSEIEHQIAASTLTSQVMVGLPSSGLCKQQLIAVLTLKELSATSKSNDEWMLLPEDGIIPSRLSAISELASERLPPYMIPTLWIVAAKMPLGISGKLDRKQILGWLQDIDKTTLDKISSIATTRTLQAASSPTEILLQTVWNQVLNVQISDVNRSFFSLGGDSISAMQVVARCRTRGVSVTVQEIIKCKTISKLALRTQPIRETVTYERGDVEVPFELSPIQQMFFSCSPEGENHFNQSFILQLTKKFDTTVLSRAFDFVVKRHPMLSARFGCEDGHWTQHISADLVNSYSIELHHLKDRSQVAAVQAAAHAKIDIQNGPVFAVDMLNINNEQMIHLVAHHLVIDLVSWRIILQELEQLLKSGEFSMSEIHLSFRAWHGLQSDYVRRLSTSEIAMPFKVPSSNYAYWGMERLPNLHCDTISETFFLSRANTSKLMGECNASLNTEPLDIMLSGLINSFQRAFPHHRAPPIFNEGHGRESWDPVSIDLSSTVGWFTTLAPISVASENEYGFLDILRRVKDTRQQTLGGGLPYFTSLYQHHNSTGLFKEHFPPEVIFNYSGRYQQLEQDEAIFKPVSIDGLDLIVPDIYPKMPRFALLEVSATVDEGHLRFTFSYNRHMQRQQQIRKWIKECEQLLNISVDLLLSTKTHRSLSDFPLLATTYDGVDKLVNETFPLIEVGPEDIEDVYPCSPMQQRILIHQGEVTRSYNVQNIWRINSKSEAPELTRLKTAWQNVVDRHPILRTVFVQSDSASNMFNQIVLRSSNARILHIDSHLNDADTLEFSVKQPPLSFGILLPTHRLALYTSATDTIYLKLEISHAIVDGFSLQILLRDLQLAYDGQLGSGAGPLFSEFIKYMVKEVHQPAFDYWITYIDGLSPCNLPIVASEHRRRGELCSVDISLEHLSRKLYAASKLHEVTVANIFMTAWAIVLRRFVESPEVCFGYLVSGRDAPIERIEDAVGLYINLVPCKARISQDESLQQLLIAVHDDFVRSAPNQHFTLTEAVGGDASGKPLFNTAVSFQKVEAYDEGAAFGGSILLERAWSKDPTEVCSSMDKRRTQCICR
jgi:amino acid adenylation domain-containing protein/non-ribosomal peptide synthase protein (TIGR01720 family)